MTWWAILIITLVGSSLYISAAVFFGMVVYRTNKELCQKCSNPRDRVWCSTEHDTAAGFMVVLWPFTLPIFIAYLLAKRTERTT